MTHRRDLGILGAALVVAAVILPQHLGGPDLDRTATALALAGPAAGGAISLAVGRPSLAAGALAGLGAYLCGFLAVHGWAVPLAVLVAASACALAGAVVALLTHRLDTPALLAATLLVAVGLAALAQAAPGLSGGQAGLGPIPPLGIPLTGARTLQLTATGDLHALLAATLVIAVLATAVMAGGVGALWRAVGSDRARAAGSGLHPLRAELVALAAAGGAAGFGGAMSAHLNGVATPDLFALDVVALPLLAAVFAGRGNALGAVATAVTTGLVGGLVLPDLGWHGPPSATALALGLLAIAVVASLLPTAGPARLPERTEIDVDEPWPIAPGEFSGAALHVRGLDVRAGPALVVSGLTMDVPAGRVHGLVGPNGAGKSSLLSSLACGTSETVHLEGGGGQVVVLQPQGGGGFPACTVDETLLLAARGGGAPRHEAARTAARWRARLGLDGAGATLCAELSTGRRRVLDLARVMLRRPTLLLCDEPLAGLDPGARAAAVSLLRAAAEAGLTIVVAEHDRAALASLAESTTALARIDGVPGAAVEAP
jgi:ABC-type branched-subunit amino acid transport system ATPase component/ABC-type branched-subunit amino acid transport system permease subunit